MARWEEGFHTWFANYIESLRWKNEQRPENPTRNSINSYFCAIAKNEIKQIVNIPQRVWHSSREILIDRWQHCDLRNLRIKRSSFIGTLLAHKVSGMLRAKEMKKKRTKSYDNYRPTRESFVLARTPLPPPQFGNTNILSSPKKRIASRRILRRIATEARNDLLRRKPSEMTISLSITEYVYESQD